MDNILLVDQILSSIGKIIIEVRAASWTKIGKGLVTSGWITKTKSHNVEISLEMRKILAELKATPETREERKKAL